MKLRKLTIAVCIVSTFTAERLIGETFCAPGKPCIETSGLTANQSFTVVEGGPTLQNGNKSWKIICDGTATANRAGAQPTIVITPQVDGDVLHLLHLFVRQAPAEGAGQGPVARTIRVIITQSAQGAKFANVGEVIGFRSGEPGSVDDKYCPVDLTIEFVKAITGPDAKAPDTELSRQNKCTINVSRVRKISTEPGGNAVLDVRTWRRDSLEDNGSELDVITIDIGGDLTGRVYGGPQDNVTTLGSPRASMKKTSVGSIACGGVIGKGTARPQDPDLPGGLQIGQSGYAFLVEATTIDSISGSTVNIYADTILDQSTSLARRITQIQATGTPSSASGQVDVAGIHGTILADTIAPAGSLPANIACNGDFAATLTLGGRSSVSNGSLARNGDNTPAIRVGRTLRSTAGIQTDAAGLNGQIVVNN